MKNVFVTGATGFIGSHLCCELSHKSGVNLVTLVRDYIPSETPWGQWLSVALSHTKLAQGDLLNPKTLKRILADYNIDTVIHCAAQAIVSTAQKDPASTFETNVQGTVNLLDACRQLDTEYQRIYVVSTDKVYGAKMGATESDSLDPTGIYETSKLAADLAAQAYANIYGLNVTIGRACNTYGYDLARRIIPNTIKECVAGKPPIIFEGENTTRQYIYVEDHVNAIINLAGCAHGLAIFNIGTDDILTQEQVVQKICAYFPLTPRFVKREKPLKEIGSQSLNWTKLKETGWAPRNVFEPAIKETIEKFNLYGS